MAASSSGAALLPRLPQCPRRPGPATVPYRRRGRGRTSSSSCRDSGSGGAGAVGCPASIRGSRSVTGARIFSPTAPPALKPRAWEAHCDAFHRFIAPRLGTICLADLRRGRIRDFLIEVQAHGRAHGDAPLSPASVRIVYPTLRAMLQAAVEDELIPGNPAARLGRTRGLRLEPTPRERQQRVEERVPEADGAPPAPRSHADRAAGAHVVSAPPHRVPRRAPARRARRRPGRRLQSLRAEPPRAAVREQADAPARAAEARATGRPPPALSELVAVLRAQVAGLRRRALQTGQPLAPWLFPTHAGTPPEPRNIARAVTRLCHQAGLPRRHSPHDLRHAYATLLVEAGAPLDYVQRQLGHASIQLTIDTYARCAKTKLPRHLVGALDTPREGTGWWCYRAKW